LVVVSGYYHVNYVYRFLFILKKKAKGWLAQTHWIVWAWSACVSLETPPFHQQRVKETLCAM